MALFTPLVAASASAFAGASAGKGTALLVSAGISAFGALAQVFAANQAAKFQAAVLRQQADRERLVAERDSELHRRRLSALLASQRAGRAGSGISTLEGSSLLVDDATIAEIELAVLTTKRGGDVRATRLEQSAMLARFQGRNARTAGFLSAGKSLLQPFIPRTALTGAGASFG